MGMAGTQPDYSVAILRGGKIAAQPSFRG